MSEYLYERVEVSGMVVWEVECPSTGTTHYLTTDVDNPFLRYNQNAFAPDGAAVKIVPEVEFFNIYPDLWEELQ